MTTLDHSPDTHISDKVHARRWWTLVVLCLSLLVIVMDNTILNVAIPSLMEDLHASNSQIQWIIDAYTLVFAGLLLTTGSLGDRFGRKGALQIGIILFAIGSVSAALSTSATQLIATRAFMGIGGALIMPATLSILTNVFRDAKERARAIAVWAGVSGLGVALGPVIGGLLLKHFSWSSVFWVNIPIGVIALVAGAFILPRSKDPSAPRIDLLGAALSIIGLGALLFGIIEGPSRGWTDSLVLAGFAVGVVGLAAFIMWELHTDEPMLDMRFFKNPRFSVANGAVTLTMFAMFGSLFLMTQYWQLVHGYTALEAGVRLIPFAATMMVVAPMSARVVEKLGTKRVVTGGLAIMSLAMALLSLIQTHTPYPLVISIFCLMAVGMGFTMAPATESVMGSLPREKAGVGSAVNDATRQVGGALGVAVIGSIVSSIYASDIASVVPGFGLTAGTTAVAQESLANALGVAGQASDPAAYVESVRDAFVHSLSIGLRFSSIAVLLAAILTWKFLPARATGQQHFSAADSMTAEAVGAHAAEEELRAETSAGATTAVSAEAIAEAIAAEAARDTPVAGD